MDENNGALRALALIGRLLAFCATTYVTYQIFAGGSLPVAGEVGPSVVGAVVFFLFGSVVVDFVAKMAFFAIAGPIMLAQQRR